MATFHYIARNVAGQRIEGRLELESEAAVLRALEEQGLFPTQLRQAPASSRPALRGIRSRDVGLVYSQLADLLRAGVRMLRSLDILADTTVNKRLAEIVRRVRADVADGASLTDAMRAHPEAFPPLHTAMVHAGERAGFLEDVLTSLGTFIDRQDELRNKVVGSLIYPALLVVIGTAVLVGGLLFFVPNLRQMLGSAAELPWPTLVVFAMSDALRDYALLLGLGLVAAVALGYRFATSDQGRRRIERWQGYLPVAGMAVRMVAVTRFCRILGTMLANGVPLIQALAITRDATGSRLLAEAVDEAIEAVRDGQNLSEKLNRDGIFPEQIMAMIVVAEESNQLEKVLLEIADTVERRTNRQVDQAVRLVEPLILCAIAGAIGFMALGLLLPVFTIASSLGS